jgi:hypothetical protein
MEEGVSFGRGAGASPRLPPSRSEGPREEVATKLLRRIGAVHARASSVLGVGSAPKGEIGGAIPGPCPARHRGQSGGERRGGQGRRSRRAQQGKP